MERSSRSTAQSPPITTFHNPNPSYQSPADWPPRMSRARAPRQRSPLDMAPFMMTRSLQQPRSDSFRIDAPSTASRPRNMYSNSPPVASRRTGESEEEDFSPAGMRLGDEQSSSFVEDEFIGRRGTRSRKRKAAETLSSPARIAKQASRKRPAALEPAAAPKPADAPKKPPAKRAPGKLKTDPDEKQEECDSNCCICMTEPEPQELASINGCEHFFCFGCIERWADRENTCPLCKKRFTKIEREQKRQRRGVKSTVKVKEKSQRSEFTSSIALEGLFGELGQSGIAFESFFARLGGSHFVNTQVARIIVGGMELGGSPGSASGSAAASRRRRQVASASRPATRTARARSPVLSEAAARTRELEAMFGNDDESDSEDDMGFSSFVNAMRTGRSFRRTPSMGTGGTSFSFSSMTHPPMPPPFPPARSFAANGDDVAAGGTFENALEIIDSEDDEVVVVETRH